MDCAWPRTHIVKSKSLNRRKGTVAMKTALTVAVSMVAGIAIGTAITGLNAQPRRPERTGYRYRRADRRQCVQATIVAQGDARIALRIWWPLYDSKRTIHSDGWDAA